MPGDAGGAGLGRGSGRGRGGADRWARSLPTGVSASHPLEGHVQHVQGGSTVPSAGCPTGTSRSQPGLVWFYWGLTPQEQPGSYKGGEMMMMKSVFWWRKPEYPEETTELRQVTDCSLVVGVDRS